LATVITNLLSAIPVFGQDLVELISFTNNKLETIFTICLSFATILPCCLAKLGPLAACAGIQAGVEIPNLLVGETNQV